MSMTQFQACQNSQFILHDIFLKSRLESYLLRREDLRTKMGSTTTPIRGDLECKERRQEA